MTLQKIRVINEWRTLFDTAHGLIRTREKLAAGDVIEVEARACLLLCSEDED